MAKNYKNYNSVELNEENVPEEVKKINEIPVEKSPVEDISENNSEKAVSKVKKSEDISKNEKSNNKCTRVW